MDPVTAFSIACGVIQVVDFGLEIVSNFRDLYKDGAIADNVALEDQANDLVVLESSLESLVGNALSAQLSADDRELRELARKCVGTAKQLATELKALKPATGRKRDALKSSFRALWSGNKIQEIQEQLDQYRKALDSRVLVTLSKRSDLNSVSNSRAFHSLDQKVQTLIGALQRGHTTLAQLTKDEHVATRDHITQQVGRLLISTDEELSQHLRKSLYFPDIFVRQEDVAPAHQKTFEWIFDESDAAMRPWDNFVRWLRHGHGIYWISGKAGSGKSTLMNFLVEDERTASALKDWAGDEILAAPAFFFWSLGSKLQKSTTGLLRALVYQIIGASTKLAGLLLAAHTSFWPFDIQNPTAMDITWTEKKLRTALQFLVDQTTLPMRFCLFVDGFDELAGGHDELLETFAHMAQSPRVKCCIASRPWPIFEKAFQSSPRLKLQDLTRADIKLYVAEKLDWNKINLTGINQAAWKVTIVRKIVDKAEGCFLWCYLVVKTVLDGVTYDEDLSEFEQRLDILPSELEGLYQHLLESIDPVHKPQVARFFQVAMEDAKEGYSIFRLSQLILFALTVYASYEGDLTLPIRPTEAEILSYCEKIKIDVPARTRGLLEVYERDMSHGEPFDGGPFTGLDSLTIRFFHKSTYEYLDNHPDTIIQLYSGKFPKLGRIEILRAGIQARTIYIRCILADSYYSSGREWTLYSAFFAASELMLESCTAEEHLVDELSNVIASCRASGTSHDNVVPWAIHPIDEMDSHASSEFFVCFYDVLAHAAFLDMTPFVLRKLEQVPVESLEETRNLLFICAVMEVELLKIDGFSLASELLRAGARPNLMQEIYYTISPGAKSYVPYASAAEIGECVGEETTPWKQWLQTMLSFRSFKAIFRHSRWAFRTDIFQRWARLATLFLEAGALTSQTIPVGFPTRCITPRLFKCFKGTTSGPISEHRDPFSLFWDTSAFRVMHLCFEGLPEFGQVFDRFHRDGATASRCNLRLHVYRRKQDFVEELALETLLTAEKLAALEARLDLYEQVRDWENEYAINAEIDDIMELWDKRADPL